MKNAVERSLGGTGETGSAATDDDDDVTAPSSATRDRQPWLQYTSDMELPREWTEKKNKDWLKLSDDVRDSNQRNV